MSEEKISVIIPAYNAEKYISRCLDSVLRQTYRNIEIIVINDGSNDNTLNIIEEYKKKDNRIIIINQNNSGLSFSRNVGLDHMSSEYCVFVDSDDDILPEMIEILYNLLKKYDCDISVANFLTDKDKYNLNNNIEHIKVFEGSDKYQQIWDRNVMTVVQWNKLFKKDIFKDIRYPENKYHEDEFVIHRQLYNANRIVYTDRILYLYHDNPESISRNKTMLKAYHALLAFKDRLDFFAEKGINKYVLTSYFHLLFMIDSYLRRSKEYEDRNEYIEKINDIKNDAINKYSNYSNIFVMTLGRIRNIGYMIKIRLFELFRM